MVGGMGSGKTRAMAFLVDELSRMSMHLLPRPKLCYHYCRSGQTGRAISVFSTLILSLLEQLSGLKRAFHNWYKEKQMSGMFDPAASTKELQSFLGEVLEMLDRPLFVLIDGLDECDRLSRSVLLEFLHKMVKKTPRLKILYSSRPEEEILEQLVGVATIDINSQDCRDAMIVRHRVDRQLSYLSSSVRTLVIDSLTPLAQGSAIWITMVIELIALRKIRALEPMREFLKNIPLPWQLSEVYTTLLSRSTSDDCENRRLAITALGVLAVARRPLSLQEVAWAAAFGATDHSITEVADIAPLVDQQRLLCLIHPFIARVEFSDGRRRQVQLSHESVKSFIVNQWPRWREHGALNERLSLHDLEAFILHLCIDYLLLDEVGSHSLFSEEQTVIDEMVQEVDLFEERASFEYDPFCTWEVWEETMIRYDPAERGFGEFFVYASSHWVDHFAAEGRGPLPCLAKLESLCRARSTRLDNWINQHRRPGCAMKARFEFDSALYDPLSITALYGSDSAFRVMLEQANFDKHEYLTCSAMKAADQILQWGALHRLRMLFLEGQTGKQLRNLEFFHLVITQWNYLEPRHDDWQEAFSLVDHVLDMLVEEHWGNELLCVAARVGCLPMIERLFDHAQYNAELKNELMRGSRLISEAVLGNHIDVVTYLLRQDGIEPHVRWRGSCNENILHITSERCTTAMFRVLSRHLPNELYHRDNSGDTALAKIIEKCSDSQDRYESMKVLLSRGKDDCSGSIDDGARSPLRLAVQNGDLEMCSLLICEGRMDPLVALRRNQDGKRVLKDEPRMNNETLLQMLEAYSVHSEKATHQTC